LELHRDAHADLKLVGWTYQLRRQTQVVLFRKTHPDDGALSPIDCGLHRE
jgi:hypothetical protein